MAGTDMELTIRSATPEDYDDLLRVEIETWSEDLVSDDAIQAGLNTFADGYFCAFADGELAGSLATILITQDIREPIHRWGQMTADGSLTTHDPNGNVMFGAALSVSERFQGLGIGTQLIQHAKRFIVEHNLDGFVGASRIPLYHQHSKMPVEAYVEKRDDDGNRFDPELRFYERCLTLGEIIPEYMSGDWADPESLNYGVKVYWLNPR
jgi:GNAT superfamily N-acetyltransferase